MFTTSVSLLERLRQPGQTPDWERFVQLYLPLFLRWGGRLGLQQQDADDLAQEVLLVLFKKLPQFTYDKHKSFRSWLYTVFLNKWRDQRRRHILPAAPDAKFPEPAVPDGCEAFDEAEYRQYLGHRALEVMQSQFEPASWKACWACVVEGQSAAQVAAALGLTENAVYIAKCRVLQRLRQELAGLLE
jgi:RNA polymerase sigma-70 factor (ECF subfamily)